MKLVIGIDGDGHFMASEYHEREKVVNLLKNVHDGDYWANLEDDIDNIDTYNTLDEKGWESFVQNFVQRATLEIVTI